MYAPELTIRRLELKMLSKFQGEMTTLGFLAMTIWACNMAGLFDAMVTHRDAIADDAEATGYAGTGYQTPNKTASYVADDQMDASVHRQLGAAEPSDRVTGLRDVACRDFVPITAETASCNSFGYPCFIRPSCG